MNIYALRQQIGCEIVDYNQLKMALKDYAYPRRKISTWLESGDLIRVKKGLYVFGSHVAREPYSCEILANLIYGPSALSLHYALSFHGLIPEAVFLHTSITNKRNKIFTTPVGNFSYQYLHQDKYAIGIDLISNGGEINFLMASPEKALCDLIALDIKDLPISSVAELEIFLFDDLRLYDTGLMNMDINLIQEITDKYNSLRLTLFTHYLTKWRKMI